MKLFTILSNRYTLIIAYSMILISGEHWGGFYIVYVLLALPYGATHALLALSGFILVLLPAQRVLRVAGLFFLVASIIYFFLADRQEYNRGSFDQVLPLLSMAFAAVVGLCFLVGLFMPKRIAL